MFRRSRKFGNLNLGVFVAGKGYVLDQTLPLSGDYSVLGRSIVIHKPAPDTSSRLVRT